MGNRQVISVDESASPNFRSENSVAVLYCFSFWLFLYFMLMELQTFIYMSSVEAHY